MRMKRMLLLLALAFSALAASWDGTIGDLTLATSSQAAGQTTFNISCSNPSVTAIRIKVTFLVPSDGGTSPDWEMYGTITKTVDLMQRSYRGQQMSFVSVGIPVDQSMISIAPQITELMDGPVISF